MTDIPDSDLEIEQYPPVPTGGQHVGRSNYGVKVTHIPTGLIAICMSERSSFRNKAVAINMILGGLTTPTIYA